MSDDLANAGITAKERLENIEKLLDRMDRKLDAKVNISEFLELSSRVRDIELHGSSAMQDTMKQVADIRAQANEQLDNMEGAVTALREDHAGLKVRIAYGAGFAAAAVIVAEFLLSKFIVK